MQYQPWVIVLVLVWAALHDRPVSWACQPKNWRTTTFQPWKLPSDSTLSARAKTAGIALFLRALEERLRNVWPPHLVARLDGKSLPVGGATKDRTARYGRAAGVMAKGYKLHAVWAGRPMPETWDVTPLNAAEVKVAEAALVPQLQGGGYLLADGSYDSSPLHAAAAKRNYQLVAPSHSPNAGQGHHYQSPFRGRSIPLLQGRFGKDLYALRGQIERDFGNAATFAGGLTAPPAGVRTLPRVRLWVWIKLLINAVRIIRLHRLAT
ncbi:MAG TPA: transposase [Planctomycetaceae bacterium]|nr:transposase [Planctomycetaceae bacterium]